MWRCMMYDHLEMTEMEATLRLNGKYEDDIRIFDKIETEALKWLIICTVALLIRYVKKKETILASFTIIPSKLHIKYILYIRILSSISFMFPYFPCLTAGISCFDNSLCSIQTLTFFG